MPGDHGGGRTTAPWLLAVPLLAGVETLGAGAERPLVRHEASRMSMACEYVIVADAADAGTLPRIGEGHGATSICPQALVNWREQQRIVIVVVGKTLNR